MKRWVRWILVGLCFELISCVAFAETELVEAARDGVYSATGIYDPEIVQYENGLTLILKQRRGVRSVSARVYVGVGMAHYPCGQRHVPHYLEHMLYDSIPGMPEKELEGRFFELGATANAFTQSTETIFELDVFSGTAMEALDLTVDMLTESEIRERSFENAKRVIFREEGGEPGPVEKQSLVGGRLASGAHEALADVSPRHFGVCGIWDTGQGIDYSMVKRAYERHYAPGRMVWVITGDFDRSELLRWTTRRLASLVPVHSQPPTAPQPGGFEDQLYSGFASEPGVTLMAFTDGLVGVDFYAHSLINHVIDARLFERLRVDTALTYTPSSSIYSESNWGIFFIQADTKTADQRQAMAIIDQLVADLTEAAMEEGVFRAAQLSLLRNWAQGVETNAGYADHYIASLPQFWRDGYFVNDEARIAALTPTAVQEAARRLFADDNTVYVRDGDRQSEIGSEPGS